VKFSAEKPVVLDCDDKVCGKVQNLLPSGPVFSLNRDHVSPEESRMLHAVAFDPSANPGVQVRAAVMPD
jgi:hypothetical protein